ncbi:MAG: hypothetical protein Q7U13_08380 [Rhodoferax sp.]|nr:hypothetical protein [Rhodoferax sp.]
MKWFFAASSVATLLACGGGGGASPTPTATTTYPASGTYALALKATGSTSAPSLGLSLIHPDERAAEYQIETTTANLTDIKTMYSGTVDVAGNKVTAVQPVALLYTAGGDIKLLPLVASGLHPKTNVLSARVTTLCRILLEGNDYAAPTSSQYIASTKGVDGICGTADDAQAKITFDSTGKPLVSPLAVGAKTLGLLRDPATQKPAAWIDGGFIYQWYPVGITYAMRASSPPITKVVSQSPDAVVAEYNNQLTVWSVGGAETVLNAGITSGVGWQSIGFDASNFYVSYSSGSTTASTWKIVKISRSSPTATLLASGSGFVTLASMGTNFLLPTIASASGYTLYKVSKSVPGTPTTVEGPSTTALPTVLSSNQGLHLLWRVNLAGAGISGYTIEMLDESTGNKPYAAAGGFPQGMVEPSTIDLTQSENRSRFIFATGATAATGLLGASVVNYDAATRAPTILGNLPGSAEYGNNPVTAGTSFGAMNLQGGYVAMISGGTVQSATLKMFSVDLRSANSLQYTTTAK